MVETPKRKKVKDDISPRSSLLSGLKWKPASTFKKSLPKAKKKKRQTPTATPIVTAEPEAKKKSTSGRKRDRSRKKKSEAQPETQGPPLVVATKGPRCRKQDSDEMYAVQAIVKKWVGRTDRSKRDVFYLIHFVGQKEPPIRGADEALWQHPSQMRQCEKMIAEFEDKWEQQQIEAQATRKPKYYFYVSESEEEDKKSEHNDPRFEEEDRLAADSSHVNGRMLRKRSENGGGDAHALIETAKPVSKKKERKEQKVGFDRGLVPDQVIGCSYLNRQLLYLIQWRDNGTVDFVHAGLCHKYCPELVIEYLVSKLKDVPTIASSDDLRPSDK